MFGKRAMADFQFQPIKTPKLREPKFYFSKYAKHFNVRKYVSAIIGFVLSLLWQIYDCLGFIKLPGFTVNNRAGKKKVINSFPSRQVYVLISLRNFSETCSVLG